MESRALVGRDRELLAFDDALAAVVHGERVVLMLSGEPGIGKTRLLEALAARMLARGGCVAWGRTSEVGATPPFLPFREALSALETQADPAPALGTVEERADHSAQLARFAEVVGFLARRADRTPLAVLFDDMHAADAASLQLLEHLLPRLLGRRILLALSMRDEQPRAEIRGALGRIQRSALRLPLARLARPEVHALVGTRAGLHDAERLFALSEGNPLFVEELLSSLLSDGALRLPALSSVRELIRARLAGLPAACRAALLAASIVGRDFRGELVAHMLGERGLGHALQPALALGVISMTAPDRYRFSHALVAEAIGDEVEPSACAQLHLRAAHAMQQCAPDDRSAIAHHLLAAGPRAAEAAGHAAEAAAEQCSAQLAFEDAAALLERALLASPLDARRRAQLLCARAEALQHATRHAAASELCEQAAAIARTLPDAADSALFAEIAWVRGLAYSFGRIDPLLVSLLCEALERLGDRASRLRPRLLARLAVAEQPAPDPREPVRRALLAIEESAQLPPHERMDVAYVATAALIDFTEPRALEAIQLEVLALARGRDRSIYVHTLLRLCFTALDRIDRAAFDARVEEFSAAAAQLGLLRWTRQVPMLHALTGLLEGRFADAAAAARASAALSSELGDAGASWLMDVHQATSAAIRTDTLAPDVAARLRNYAPGRAHIQAWFGVLDGERDAARAGLAALDVNAPVAPDLGSMVAAAVIFVEDTQLAAALYEALQPRSGRIVLAGMVGMAVLDVYDRLLLRLAALCGRWDDVTRHAEQGLAVASRLASPVWTARLQADWADALQRRGRPEDAVQARDLCVSALATAERLGMPGLIRQARMALAPREPRESHVAAADELERAGPLTLTKQGALWQVRGLGVCVHVKDSRGMQLLARLVAEPGRELHVLDLALAAGLASGDAGPALDPQARAAYRARLTELSDTRKAAEAAHDLGRAERAASEIEALQRELARAFGIGGRPRTSGASSERARSNIQRRIAHAITQVRAASPVLGDHLSRSVRTGTVCVYAPRP